MCTFVRLAATEITADRRATDASDLMHAAKHDRDFVDAIEQAEEVAPGQARFIDDVQRNVDGAKQGGCEYCTAATSSHARTPPST